MKRFLRIVIPVLVLAALLWVGYGKRAELAARIWHWRHGDTTLIGGYIVHIPSDWVVRDQNDRYLVLADTGFRSRPDPNQGPSLTSILLNPGGRIDIEKWRAFQKQKYESSGGQAPEEHTTHFDGQTVVCVRTDIFENALHVTLNGFVSLNCVSTAELDFLFSGHQEDVQSFYGVLEQIHKVDLKQ